MNETSPWPFLPGKRSTSVARAEGAFLYLSDGRRILDAAGGAVVSNIGHGRREVAEVVRASLERCTYVVPPWKTEERVKLVEELRAHWLPGSLDRVHLASGGSEANEAAIKMAIQYHASRGQPERNVILARSVSYHGTTISTAALSGHAGRKRGLEGYLADCPRILTPYPLRCPLGAHHPGALSYYLQNLRDTISEVGAENIAALIAEPMNGSSGGAITPPEGYWPAAQAILREHGILLIVDEVMTGFGRTGVAFGSTLFEIEPDILVAGKGLASGYAAIAGIYAGEALAESIEAAGLDVMFHTFGALPHACAAATKVLEILREEELVERSRHVGTQLRDRLQERFGQHPNVAEIRGEGMLTGIEVVSDRNSLTPFPVEDKVTERLVAAAMNEGVFFYPGGTGEIRDILCIGAPFIIGDEEIDLMTDALAVALGSLGQ